MSTASDTAASGFDEAEAEEMLAAGENDTDKGVLPPHPSPTYPHNGGPSPYTEPVTQPHDGGPSPYTPPAE